MSKKIAQEITELVDKWSQVRVAYPVGWADERYLSESEVSYKTYLADEGRNAHRAIELKIANKKVTLTFWSDGVVLESPIASPVSAKTVLKTLQDIYTEATSTESIAEGKIKLREEIARAKSELRSKQKDIKKLENELRG